MSIRYLYSESSGQEVIASSGTPLLYPRHIHMRHWTLGMVRQGVAALESPAGMRRIGAGGFFLVPPRMPHALRIAGHSEFVALCLDKEYMLQYAKDAFPGAYRFLSPREYELVERIIGQFARHACSLEDQRAESAMRRLAQRLVATPEETLSVAEMAQIACVSPWHFLRCFRMETGMTPHAFLLNCKIRRLRSLLRRRVAAADAAVLMGFADQSHMHKLFRLHHNLTPRQFVLASGRLDDVFPGCQL